MLSLDVDAVRALCDGGRPSQLHARRQGVQDDARRDQRQAEAARGSHRASVARADAAIGPVVCARDGFSAGRAGADRCSRMRDRGAQCVSASLRTWYRCAYRRAGSPSPAVTSPRARSEFGHRCPARQFAGNLPDLFDQDGSMWPSSKREDDRRDGETLARELASAGLAAQGFEHRPGEPLRLAGWLRPAACAT